MGTGTKIGWCDHTFNPWEGCQRVSPGCDRCYAEARAARFRSVEWGPRKPRRRLSAAYWKQPLRWNAGARESGTRPRVFCASLADVFDNQVPEEWRADLWALIRECSALDWLLLTKRPQNMAAMLPHDWGAGYPNAALGVTAEDQKRAQERVPILLDTPAAMRFVSVEPMLERVDFNALSAGPENLNALTGLRENPFGAVVARRTGTKLDWVICGGESGPGARAMDPDWARALRDQCAGAGAAFFMKQMGGHPEKRDRLEDLPKDLRIRQFPKGRAAA